MCLYIDDDGDWLHLDSGTRRARKPHRCQECNRTIDPGEVYEYWTGVMDGRAYTAKACAHCRATVTLGARLAGCPENWNGEMLWDEDPEIGFVANILDHDALGRLDRLRMLRCVAAFKRKWRWSDGTLMALPTVPAEAVAA